jgi:hypothetical protein
MQTFKKIQVILYYFKFSMINKSLAKKTFLNLKMIKKTIISFLLSLKIENYYLNFLKKKNKNKIWSI